MGEGESEAVSSTASDNDNGSTTETIKKALEVEKDEDGVYDLSAFMAPRFRYALPELDVNGEPTENLLKCNLDFDTIVLKLQASIPTAIAAAGTIEVDDPANPGKKKEIEVIGLTKIMKGLMEGDRTDPSLPTADEVFNAVERAFDMPAGYGTSVKMALLSAFMKEAQRRAGLKKGTRDLADSPGPTPDSSIPEVSTPKQ